MAENELMLQSDEVQAHAGEYENVLRRRFQESPNDTRYFRFCIHRQALKAIGDPVFLIFGYQPDEQRLMLIGTWGGLFAAAGYGVGIKCPSFMLFPACQEQNCGLYRKKCGLNYVLNDKRKRHVYN